MTRRAAVTPTAVLLTPPKALTRVSARPTHKKSLPMVCSHFNFIVEANLQYV